MSDLSLGSLFFLAMVAFLAGIIDAISGGGGLLTLPTYLLIGIPGNLISGTNLSSSIPGALVAAVRFTKGGKAHIKSALIGGPMAIVGAILGARLNLFIPAHIIEYIVMILVPIIGVIVMLKPTLGNENQVHTLSQGHICIRALLIGFFIGGYNGFIGAGAGTFYLLAFAVFLKLDLVTASGTTKVCGLFSVFAAVVTYGASGAILWDVAIFVAVFHMSGNYIGAGLALKKGAKVIRPMFILALALLTLRMAVSVLG